MIEMIFLKEMCEKHFKNKASLLDLQEAEYTITSIRQNEFQDYLADCEGEL